MNLKDNIAEQKEYLEMHTEQLNTVVSAILGYRTRLKVTEHTQGNRTYFKVVDDRNLREKCGVMAKAFRNVTISNFGMWWFEDGVAMDLHFNYEHLNGGTNGAEFCSINIINGLVTIREN